MNSILRKPLCLLMILCGISWMVKAQTNVPKFQLGAGIGTFIYFGDLTPTASGSYKTLKPALDLFASKLLSPSFALRANLAFGKLKGDDAKYNHPDYRQQRNFNFTSPVAEIAGLAEWNVLGRNYSSRGFSPYLFGGIGYSFLKIKRDWSHLNLEYFGNGSELVTGLAIDAQHSLPKSLLVFPVGAGTRYYITDKIGISAEASWRLMSTDYLDGFSQAANPTRGDHYGIYSVGAVYRVGKKNTLACPVMKY
ncbi:MAG: DUF6089 family protein [Bacteroidota bacterium]|nr:DUF6089 family protein [Bacteroidota bacterium]